MNQCPVCHSQSRKAGTTVAVGEFGRSDIFCCTRCQHRWIPNPWAKENGIANQIVDRGGTTLSLNWIFGLLPIEVASNKRKRVGCWDGALLAQLPEGWVRHGVEFNHEAAERARAKGLTIFEFKLEELGGEVELRYDLIFMMDVLEHVSAPEIAFSQIGRLLAPGGFFVALTGNVGTMAVRLFGGAWYYFNYPEHITFFSEKSFLRGIKSAGLAPLMVRHVTHHSATSGATLRRICRRLFRPRKQGEAGLANPSFFFEKVALALSRVARGKDHLLVLARKPP